jgi:hypothetical protein
MRSKLNTFFIALVLLSGVLLLKERSSYKVESKILSESLVSEKSLKTKFSRVLDEKTNLNLDVLLEKENKTELVKVLRSHNTLKDQLYIIENSASIDSIEFNSGLKNRLFNIMSKSDLSTVFKGVEILKQYEFSKKELKTIAHSMCRFQKQNTYGFEVLKIKVNRDQSFKKNQIDLMTVCERLG